MKTITNLVTTCAVIMGACLGVASAQQVGLIPQRIDPATGLPEVTSSWPGATFSIAFGGGPPEHFVDAIEAASGTALNVIIPEEHKGFSIPPLKLQNVTVPQLFDALSRANTGAPNRFGQPVATTSYGFRSSDQPRRTNSIWYFFVDNPPRVSVPESVVRFWNVEKHLQTLKVEDITTAIETGWKMLGAKPQPKLTFHKDTKLLIVVGPPVQLAMIDDVLRQLTREKDAPKDSKSAQAAGEKPSK